MDASSPPGDPPTLAETLPFLARLPNAHLARIATALGVSRDQLLASPVKQFASATAVAAATTSAAWDTMVDEPLVELVPSIRALNGRPIDFSKVWVRLANLMLRHGVRDWTTVGSLTLREVLDWRNAGAGTARHLLALVVEAGSQVMMNAEGLAAAGQDWPSRSREENHQDLIPQVAYTRENPVVGAIRLIGAWASGEHAASSLLDAMAVVSSLDDVPDEIREARELLQGVNLEEFTMGIRSRYEIASATGRVLDQFSELQVAVLAARPLAVGRKQSLEELGAPVSLTRERIRQIEGRALDRLQVALSDPDQQVLVRTARRLRREIGSAFPLEAPVELSKLIARAVTRAVDAESMQARLLLWLAGPYTTHGSWLVLRPAKDLISSTALILSDLTEAGPVPEPEALDALERVEVKPEFRRDWLLAVGGFRLLAGSVVPWRGSLADKAALVLRLSDRVMTVQEISEAIVDDHSSRTLSNYLLSDSRFLRRGLKHFGLAEWGGEEYTSIADEIEEEIERQGGEASIEYLVSTLSGNFGVSENSVRSYASSGRFERTERGAIRVRQSPGSRREGQPIELTRRCYRFKDGAWALRLRVSRDILRGSGTPVSAGVASYLSVEPGDHLTLVSPFGELPVGWSALQPAIGSIKSAVDRLGANEGDFIFLKFLGEGRLDFHLVKGTDLEAASGSARTALEVGTTLQDWDGDIVAALANAVGLSGEVAPDVIQIRQRLSARREDELSDGLPSGTGFTSPSDAGDALDRLTAALAGFPLKPHEGATGSRGESIERRPYEVAN